MNGLLLLTAALGVNIAATAAIQFLRDRAWRAELKRKTEEAYWRGYVDTVCGRRSAKTMALIKKWQTISPDRRVPEPE
jgi:hypothetical protein